ncbi:MAG: hypothetical protein CUN56_00515 [Phototrophicales bacterium]|nr:MAG: hypothetical protein CUN56_00515 [Phototrophicales bacterium]
MGSPASIGFFAVSQLLKMGAASSEAEAVEANARAQMVAREYQAKQLKQQAGQERASAQREMAEEQRRKKLIASRARAQAAASGASALDVLSNIAGIELEGDYRSRVAAYEGEEVAKGLEHRADASLYEGQLELASARRRAKSAKRRAVIDVASSIGGKLYDRYGFGFGDDEE